MLLKDHWYIACPSSQLHAGEPKAVQIGEHDLVVFRDGAGSAHVLLDRCCHRGVKLSCGRITDGNLACGYHGWQYDGEGVLVLVPSLAGDAKTPNHVVPAYQTMESEDYVWVWMAGESAEPTYQPGMLTDEEPGVWIQQTAIWDANIMDAVENQMDGAHTPFSHPGTYPTHHTEVGTMPPLKEHEAECRVTAEGVEFFAPATESADQPVPASSDLAYWAAYELPYRNYVFITTEDVKAIYNWIPLADGKCRLEFMTKIGQLPADHAGPTNRIVEFVEEELEILRQDRVLLESARVWVDRGRREYEKSVPTDFPQLQSRRLHKAALSGEQADFAKQDQKRHLFSYRA